MVEAVVSEAILHSKDNADNDPCSGTQNSPQLWDYFSYFNIPTNKTAEISLT